MMYAMTEYQRKVQDCIDNRIIDFVTKNSISLTDFNINYCARLRYSNDMRPKDFEMNKSKYMYKAYVKARSHFAREYFMSDGDDRA